jgi:hypothetical protein
MTESPGTIRSFLVLTLAWAVAIFLPMVALELLSDPIDPAQYARWLARALAIAVFPASITLSSRVATRSRPWRVVRDTAAAAVVIAFAVLVLMAWLPAVLGDENRSVLRLAITMRTSGASWETMNNASWRYFEALLSPAQALLYSAIGFQLGIWGPRAMTQAWCRVLYWCVGLGLIIVNFGVADTTYETIILRTAADVRFASAYAFLLPAGIAAGLFVPTLAVLRRPEAVDRRTVDDGP